MQTIECVDSHTGGEPTRLVLAGFPEFGDLPLPQVVELLRTQHDDWRRATVCEPRGSDVIVGALLLPPRTAVALASVVFFNNVGYLGMCGHGTIGVMATLEHLGRVEPGSYVLDTPVGSVGVRLLGQGRVSLDNVPAYRHRAAVCMEVTGYGSVSGDVAWGGNWFFLCKAEGIALELASLPALEAFCEAIRRALAANGVTGEGGAEIDHIELMGPASDPANNGRNFVMCPGGAYDRSPCGTGTSAKLACLAADGVLAPGQLWRQESVLGSVFEASYQLNAQGRILPTISGQAFVCGRSTLLLNPADPFCWGI